MQEADQAIDTQQYDVAAQKLQKARQLFNQLSNFHLQLSESFSGIDNRIAEEQRNRALETGQMRDEATYQLALVHRAQNQPELSVPLLIQVVRSQNPTSELGKKSYQQLLEIGFAQEPFSTPTSPTSGK
jgi:capsule polysaccharide export protein KpsC/LpsZ